MAAILNEALLPNLVQSREGTPAFVHGGPFANIAHGCNSVLATRMALALADYAVTEAGFAFDLGGEKFFDLKCRSADLNPAAVVIVATIRALKMHGGVAARRAERARPRGRRARAREPGRPPRQRRALRQADARGASTSSAPTRPRSKPWSTRSAPAAASPAPPPTSSAPAGAAPTELAEKVVAAAAAARDAASDRSIRWTGRPSGRSSRSPG